jgi:hypothetical protein
MKITDDIKYIRDASCLKEDIRVILNENLQ